MNNAQVWPIHEDTIKLNWTYLDIDWIYLVSIKNNMVTETIRAKQYHKNKPFQRRRHTQNNRNKN